MTKITRIASRDIPIEPGESVTVTFTRGRLGEGEAGAWELWTVVDEAGSWCNKRCRLGCDPGEPFREMERKPRERDGWKIAVKAVRMRPSNRPREVNKWLDDHPEDAPHAVSCLIGGSNVPIVKTGEGLFRLES